MWSLPDYLYFYYSSFRIISNKMYFIFSYNIIAQRSLLLQLKKKKKYINVSHHVGLILISDKTNFILFFSWQWLLNYKLINNNNFFHELNLLNSWALFIWANDPKFTRVELILYFERENIRSFGIIYKLMNSIVVSKKKYVCKS